MHYRHETVVQTRVFAADMSMWYKHEFALQTHLHMYYRHEHTSIAGMSMTRNTAQDHVIHKHTCSPHTLLKTSLKPQVTKDVTRTDAPI